MHFHLQLILTYVALGRTRAKNGGVVPEQHAGAASSHVAEIMAELVANPEVGETTALAIAAQTRTDPHRAVVFGAIAAAAHGEHIECEGSRRAELHIASDDPVVGLASGCGRGAFSAEIESTNAGSM